MIKVYYSASDIQPTRKGKQLKYWLLKQTGKWGDVLDDKVKAFINTIKPTSILAITNLETPSSSHTDCLTIVWYV
jgi:hypothetical protein